MLRTSESYAGAGGLSGPLSLPAQSAVTHQEVRVYQNASGDLLLKAECTPVFKSGQNFDLSEDGSLAAVVRDGSIVVYKLPALSQQDREDIAEVERFAPPPSEAMVSLTRLAKGPAAAAAVGTAPEASVAGAAGVASPAASVPVSPEEAPAETPARRKPPTLLNPGEHAEIPAKN
jgi:hypothetical protein